MKILEWIHRKFSPKHAMPHRPKDYSPGPQVLSDEYPCGDTLTLQFSNWKCGMLAIGTFGFDAQFDGEEAVAHAFKVIQADEHLPFQKDEFVNVTVDDKDADCKFYGKEKEKSNGEYKVGIKIRTLEEFFKDGSPAGDSIHNNKKKFSAAQSLGNCLFGNGTRDALVDVKRCNGDSKRKEDEAPEKIGCSPVKNILKWKMKGSRSSKVGQDTETKLHKMKIQPEAAAAAMGGLRSGRSDASKTLNIPVESCESIKRYGEEEVGSSNNNSTTSWEETLSLSRDSSRGSREYWVKTDSEYVVLEL